MESVKLIAELDPTYSWLFVAIMLLALEAIGISGVGLVFGGIAAFILGALLELDLVKHDAYSTQVALWFMLTVVFAVVLFRPLKRWRTDPSATETFNNMVGDTATVGAGGLMLGKPGKVLWSGALMNAQISPSSKREAFIEDDIVKIESVKGNQLIVIPYNQEPSRS